MKVKDINRETKWLMTGSTADSGWLRLRTGLPEVRRIKGQIRGKVMYANERDTVLCSAHRATIQHQQVFKTVILAIGYKNRELPSPLGFLGSVTRPPCVIYREQTNFGIPMRVDQTRIKRRSNGTPL